MVDLHLIRTHDELRQELSNLIISNELRAYQITTAILKLGIIQQNQLQSKKPAKSSPKKKAPSSNEEHHFEIELNKLKQQYSTESKLKDVKLDSFKKENEKLKLQIKNLSTAQSSKRYTSSSSSSSISSNFFKNQRNRIPSGKSIFTPDKFKSSTNSTYVPFYKRSTFTTIFDDELMTPIKKEKKKMVKMENKFKDILESVPAEDINSKLTEDNESDEKEENEENEKKNNTALTLTIGPSATSSPTALRQSTTPSKYIENFDNEDDDKSEEKDNQAPHQQDQDLNSKTSTKSPSPDFTPQRRPRMTRSLTSSAAGPNNSTFNNTDTSNLHISTITSPTTLIMQNKTKNLESHDSPTNNKIRKIKKIKKITSTDPDTSTTKIKKENSIFNISSSDDEIDTSFNIINKFEDSHYIDDKNDLIDQPIVLPKRKRKLSSDDDNQNDFGGDEPLKKKRNVFTID
ncbi:hypothetical protein KGF54_001974 [Candida jiufengensis]|uniref:uncharacterized protein n=1 Tax=Candida jiufengensis TaxID=497108 RepID=UPI00222530DC|nr:uncharacterized protein KGF54_001974 [Candida jiufengensis]KAI5954199.1 hypothetical protein KGF54_001974 [Candida jiufengensis]